MRAAANGFYLPARAFTSALQPSDFVNSSGDPISSDMLHLLEPDSVSESSNADSPRWHLKVDDLVMIETPIVTLDGSARFNPRFRGPFLVLQVHQNNTITVQGDDGRTATVNVERAARILRRPEHLLPPAPPEHLPDSVGTDDEEEDTLIPVSDTPCPARSGKRRQMTRSWSH